MISLHEGTVSAVLSRVSPPLPGEENPLLRILISRSGVRSADRRRKDRAEETADAVPLRAYGNPDDQEFAWQTGKRRFKEKGNRHVKQKRLFPAFGLERLSFRDFTCEQDRRRRSRTGLTTKSPFHLHALPEMPDGRPPGFLLDVVLSGRRSMLTIPLPYCKITEEKRRKEL